MPLTTGLWAKHLREGRELHLSNWYGYIHLLRLEGKVWIKTESQGWCWRLRNISRFESDPRKVRTTC